MLTFHQINKLFVNMLVVHYWQNYVNIPPN